MIYKKIIPILILAVSSFLVNSQSVLGQSRTDSTKILSTAAIKAQLFIPISHTNAPKFISRKSDFKNQLDLPYVYKLGVGLFLGIMEPDLSMTNRAAYYNYGMPLPYVYRNHTSAFGYNAYLGRLHRLPFDDKF